MLEILANVAMGAMLWAQFKDLRGVLPTLLEEAAEIRECLESGETLRERERRIWAEHDRLMARGHLLDYAKMHFSDYGRGFASVAEYTEELYRVHRVD